MGGDSFFEDTNIELDYWELLRCDFVPDAGGRIWLLETEVVTKLEIVAGTDGSTAGVDSLEKMFMRPLLLDLADLVISLGSGTAIHSQNLWRPLGTHHQEMRIAITEFEEDGRSRDEQLPDLPTSVAEPSEQENNCQRGIAAQASALVCKMGEDDKDALQVAIEKREQARTSGDKKQEITALNHLIQVHVSHKSLHDASHAAEEALSLCRDLGDKDGQAAMWITIANIHLENQIYGKAIKAAKNARVFAREIGNENILADALHIISTAELNTH